MKFVDAEVTREDEGGADVVRAPRPARRRVYTSLIVTLSVLIGTVVVIYSMFPNRQNEIMTLAVLAHTDSTAMNPQEFALESPSGTQIRAWSKGVFGIDAPWPEVGGNLVPQYARVLRVFKRDVALVGYTLGQQTISVVMLRARDAPPRKMSRNEDGLYSVSWRQKKFTSIVIGPVQNKKRWMERFGVPAI